MPARYDDWLRQAKRDLSHARRSLEDGEYEWASFAAHKVPRRRSRPCS